MRLLLTCLGIVAALPLAARLGAGQVLTSSSEKPLYVNREYGFSVRLPPDVRYDRTAPPNPDHGFGIDVSEHEKLWVDASLTEAPAVAHALRKAMKGCHREREQAALLDGRKATLLQIACPRTAYNAAYEERVLMAEAVPPGRSPILYQVALRTEAGKNSAAGGKLFDAVVTGLRFASVH